MDKKNVAILTINDNNNYGNRLQNYALQETLKKLNCDVKTIWQLNHSYIHKFLAKKKVFLNKKSFKLRYKNFNKFNNDYLDVVDYKFPNLKKINNNFDKFVVGSDQVWNFNFNCFSDEYFLKFADYDKTISYAASFGIKEIPENFRKNYEEGLKSIKNISVREEDGKRIVKEIIGKDDVQVVLDPTLLLSREEWKKISKKPIFVNDNEKFALKCFLGEMPEQYRNDINNYIQENNIRLYDICDMDKDEIYSISPNELLYMVENSECIFTNSFHISVFSVIFNKKFFVYDKKSKTDTAMNSRIDTLLKNCNIENNRNPIYECLNSWNVDYNDVEKRINKLKDSSIEFLKNAIK